MIAERAGVRNIDLAEDRLQIRFRDRPPIEPEALLRVMSNEGGSLRPSGMLVVPAPPRGADRIEAVQDLLLQIVPPEDGPSGKSA